MTNIKNKIKNVASFIRRKVSIKKAIAIIITLVMTWQCGSSAVLTISSLNRKSFLSEKKASKIMTEPLSAKLYKDWLSTEASSITVGEGSKASFSAYELKNVVASHSYMVLLHPVSATPEDMASIAYHFFDMGFNVLVPDYLESKLSYGVNEKEKLVLCVKKIVESDESAQIYILGMGIGASTALLASGGDMPDNVKGIVADSAYFSAYELFKENCSYLYGFSSFPKVSISSVCVTLFGGWSFGECDMEAAVEQTDIPILYIHGTEDKVVPMGQSSKLLNATKSDESDRVRILAAGHCQALNKDADKYYSEVEDFIRNTVE